MKSNSFEYVRANSLDEVLEVLSERGDEAKILAGGQSLIPAMNMRFAAPEVLVDVGAVSDLQGIKVIDGSLRIGAMSRHVDVLHSSEVFAHAPMISDAIPHIAHATIRNRGTFGGSLCNADPASELPACALALNASFNIQSAAGTRVVAARDFVLGTYTTCLAEDEILVSVDIPVTNDNTLWFFGEVSRRKGDYAIAGLAAKTELIDGVLANSRIVFFGVSEVAVSSPSAEMVMNASTLSSLQLESLTGAVADDITPFDDLTTTGASKMAIMKTLVKRAIADFAKQRAV